MDFYISDIAGVQTPYSEEIYQKSLKAEEARALQLAEESAYAIEMSPETNSTQASQSTVATPISDNSPEAIATGLAGASVTNRRGQVSSSADSEDIEDHPKQKGRKKDLRPVSKTASAHAIRADNQGLTSDDFPQTGRYVNPYWRLDQEQQKREKVLLAEQIMSSPVVTLSVDDSASDALGLFKKGRFRHLPVINNANTLVGIVSDRSFIGLLDHDKAVGELMRANIISARPHTTIKAIAGLMFNERIGAMPIVKEGGELIGIVTRSDILYAIVKGAPIELWV